MFEEAAWALMSTKAPKVRFPKLDSATGGMAEAFATFKGELLELGITNLSDEAALALVTTKVDKFVLAECGKYHRRNSDCA